MRERLAQTTFLSPFDKACNAGGGQDDRERVARTHPGFPYHDLRAKTGTDCDEKEGRQKTGGLLAAEVSSKLQNKTSV